MQMNEKQRKAAIIVASILGCGALFYLGGLLGQVFTNYTIWMESGGMWGQTQIAAPDWNPAVCLLNAFSWNGVKAIFLIVVIGAGISSLFFSFLFIKLTRFADLSPGGRCPVPVNLILDEFNNIGRIGGAPDGSDFCRSLSVIRSRDIRVMLAVQSLGQLQNRYPNNLWSEIIGNCDIQLMLGCTDDVTADYISDRSGEMCIVVDSTMTVKKTVAVTQVIPQYRETQGQGKRKLLTPDEVLRLPHEQMLVIIRGQNLLLLNKFDYTRHPMSKEMVRASIMDYCPRTSYAPTPQTGSENEPDKKPQRESRGRKLSRSDTPPVEF